MILFREYHHLISIYILYIIFLKNKRVRAENQKIMIYPFKDSEPCLWVDDIRDAPPGWDLARTYNEAIIMLESKHYKTVSLDYYLSDETDSEAFNGHDILLWLKERMDNGEDIPDRIFAHSSSMRAREMMYSFIRDVLGITNRK